MLSMIKTLLLSLLLSYSKQKNTYDQMNVFKEILSQISRNSRDDGVVDGYIIDIPRLTQSYLIHCQKVRPLPKLRGTFEEDHTTQSAGKLEK